MNDKKDIVIAVLATVCLMSMMFAWRAYGSWPYNPWWDINDDGRIDVQDLARVSGAFGTYGTEINKTEMLLDLQRKVEELNESLSELERRLDYMYEATISAYSPSDGHINVDIHMDGGSTGFNTAHQFHLLNSHLFTVPTIGPGGHLFKNWSTGCVSPTINISSAGEYVAYYEPPSLYISQILVSPNSSILGLYTDPSGAVETSNITWPSISRGETRDLTLFLKSKTNDSKPMYMNWALNQSLPSFLHLTMLWNASEPWSQYNNKIWNTTQTIPVMFSMSTNLNSSGGSIVFTQIFTAIAQYGPYPHSGDSMWIEPMTVSFPRSIAVGTRFNVTVWLNMSTPANAWQFYLVYNKAHLNYIRCSYTGNEKSLWSEDLPVDIIEPLSDAHNATHDYLLFGEVLKPMVEKTGLGSLAWVEFEIVEVPPPEEIWIDELRLDLTGVFQSVALDKDYSVISLSFDKSIYTIG